MIPPYHKGKRKSLFSSLPHQKYHNMQTLSNKVKGGHIYGNEIPQKF